MRRMVIVGVAVGALVLAAAAHAVRTNHFGHLSGVPGSTVKFKESTKQGSRTVTLFAVRDFEMACSGDVPGTISLAKLTGKIDVSAGGSFKANDDNGATQFKVKGQINRNKSFGSFRYRGTVESDDGVDRFCDSGKLSWVTRP